MNDFFCPNAKSPDGRLYLKWKLAQTDSRSSPVLPWWFPWEWGSSHPPSLCTLYSNLDQGWAGRPSPGTLGSQPAVTEICKYQCLNLSVVAGNLFKKTKKNKTHKLWIFWPYLSGILLQYLPNHSQNLFTQLTWHRFLKPEYWVCK